MNNQPFNRVNILISSALALSRKTGETFTNALTHFPAYQSRGKGQEKQSKARHGKFMDNVRAARKSHNRAKRRAK